MAQVVRSRSRQTRAPVLLLACLSVFSPGPGGVALSETLPQGEQRAVAEETWAVLSQGGLRESLEGWARTAGWTVVWDSPIDYRIRVSAAFHGPFEEAVADLVDAVQQASPRLSVTLYRGDRVLHVDGQAPSPDDG